MSYFMKPTEPQTSNTPNFVRNLFESSILRFCYIWVLPTESYRKDLLHNINKSILYYWNILRIQNVCAFNIVVGTIGMNFN